MRINGFEQIKGFYSWVFNNQEKNIRTTHISLYMFLVNQNNRNNWIEWFKCPYDLAMTGSGITNKTTYYSSLNDLQDWGLIKYKKGINSYKAPIIKIEVLFDTSTVPLSEPLLQPQVIPLPVPLLQPQLGKNIKLLTSNIEQVTINIFRILDFLNLKPEEPAQNSTHYEIQDFLKDWNEIRSEVTGNPSFVNRLQPMEKDQFNEISEAYTREQFRNAIKGLFKQDKFPKGVTAMNSSPKHFLNYFELYLTAYGDKNKNVWGNED